MNVVPQLNLMHVEYVVVGFQIVISVMAQASMEMLAGVQTVLMALMKVNSAVIQDLLPMATAQNYMVVTMYLIVV